MDVSLGIEGFGDDFEMWSELASKHVKPLVQERVYRVLGIRPLRF